MLKRQQKVSNHDEYGASHDTQIENKEKACELLRQAISIAQLGGIVRPFFESGQPVKTLL